MPSSGEELKACPFCEALPGRSSVELYQDDYGFWAVGCGRCGSHSGKSKNKYAVVNLWNTRAASAEKEESESQS